MAALRVLPLSGLARLMPRPAVGLCYHTVSDLRLPHVVHLYPYKTPAQFACDLEFLHRHYEVVSYDDLRAERAARHARRPLAILTFDDGFAECESVIRPMLLKYGTPAIFFVTTAFLDNRRMFYRNKVSLCIDAYSRLAPADANVARRALTEILDTPMSSTATVLRRLREATSRDEPAIDGACLRLGIDTDRYLQTTAPYLTTAQVHTLAADGFTIGAHGTAHAHLGSVPARDAKAEILAACRAVAELVPRAEVPFAFPFNGRRVSREMLRSLRADHPQVGLFFDTRLLAPDRDFVINRIVVDDPRGAVQRQTSLPAHLRRAYAHEVPRAIVAFLRRVSGRMLYSQSMQI